MAYDFLKLIHLFAVVIFLGNIITELFWMHNAQRTKNLKIVSFTISNIIKGDKYFTIPSVIFITVAGVAGSIFGHLSTLHTGWIFWSIILFVISGLAFTIKVAPLQKKIHSLTLQKDSWNSVEWAAFNKFYLAWNLWGWVALITPVLAFVMMTVKIPK